MGWGVGVFEARINQIAALNLVSQPGIRIPGRKQIAALNLVSRPGIRIPGRKSPNLDAWGGGGGVFEARIKEISAFK